MEKYQQPNFVQPTGPVVAIASSTAAATTSSALQGGLYYITNTANVHVNIDAGTAIEVETITVSPVATSVYELTVGAVVLTSAALAASTLADLITKLQADVDYAAAPFTIATNATGITLTWKAIGVVASAGSLTKDAGAPIAAVVVTAGVGTTATTSNMLLPTGDRTFEVPNGAYISCIKATGASDGTVSITRCS
jgi:hypothetical protein